MSKKISVVVHTFNNEKIIRRCLESLRSFDEIVICDMYSTDDTLKIAEEYNCKIVMHENIGWADPARNYAISQASNEWVLVVDSDEVITPELRDYLYKFIEKPQNYSGIKIPRLNYSWGEPLEILYPDYIVRFFKKQFIYWPPYVHATPQISEGEMLTMPKDDKKLAIVHYQNWTISKLLKMLDRYTELELEKLIQRKAKFSVFSCIYKSIWIVLEKFFIKKGYKDGFRGWIVSVMFYGCYKFCAQVKYWEYLNKEKFRVNEGANV